MDGSQGLKRTPLHEIHVSLGARMQPFAGWEMPVQYSSILDESRAVRASAGIFDVSHMGRVDVRGPQAAAFLDRVFSSKISGLRTRRARYGMICNEDGGIIDDAIVYRLEEQRFLLVPNAANTGTVLEWLSKWKPAGQVRFDEVTSEQAMIALQGPDAAEMLAGLTPLDLSRFRAFRVAETTVVGAEAVVARTGYTGEDGFEIIVAQQDGAEIWGRLKEVGAEPCGLGARDVLRLEAGLLLHGNDMDTSVNPYEAGLGRFVDPDRGEYVAGSALRRICDGGVSRVLVGFNMIGRGIARHGHPIVDGSRTVGHVSSGSYSPTLDRNLGLGYVPTSYASPGTRFEIDIRGRAVEAQVTVLPFYSRKKDR